MPQSAFYLLPVTALPDLLNDRCVDQPEYAGIISYQTKEFTLLDNNENLLLLNGIP